jgi:hypothetical protein
VIKEMATNCESVMMGKKVFLIYLWLCNTLTERIHFPSLMTVSFQIEEFLC